MKALIKKYFFSLLVTAFVFCLAFSASALEQNGKCGENVYWSFNEESGELIISGTGDMYDYSSYAFVSPFYKEYAIKSVTVQQGVTSVGKAAFYECTAISSINVGEDVIRIGDTAFFGCDALGDITLTESIRKIGWGAFYGTAYYDNAENWDEEVLYIGNYAIRAKDSISNQCSVKEGTLCIADYCFSDCVSMKSINFPEGLLSIGSFAFRNCKKLNNVVVPESVTDIGNNAFCHCRGLKVITLPDSITELKTETFASCDSLVSIVVPSGITSISPRTFIYCVSLKEITVPAVVSVGERAFFGCENLEKVHFNGTAEQWMAVEFSENNGFFIDADVYCFGVKFCLHTNKELRTAVAATCLEDGYTEGVYCSDCDRWLEGHIAVKAEGHKEVDIEAVEATCSSLGLTAGKKCSVCNTVTVLQNEVPSIPHSNEIITVAATLSENGKIESRCSVCGYISETTVIHCPDKVSLSYTLTTYNGKVKKPVVIVTDAEGKSLEENIAYTVEYENGRKNPGKYTVTVNFKDKYSGSKKLVFTVKPKTPSISDIYSKTAGKAVIKWNNVTGESGYQLYYATSKSGKYQKVKSYVADKTAGSKTKLKSGKYYYFKLRAYKKTANGTVYSSWSTVKRVKIK